MYRSHALFSYSIPLNGDFCGLHDPAEFWQDNFLTLDFRPIITAFAD